MRNKSFYVFSLFYMNKQSSFVSDLFIYFVIRIPFPVSCSLRNPFHVPRSTLLRHLPQQFRETVPDIIGDGLEVLHKSFHIRSETQRLCL